MSFPATSETSAGNGIENTQGSVSISLTTGNDTETNPATNGEREEGGFLSFDAESEEWQMTNGGASGEPEKSPEEMKNDLRQLEDEINTLKQVLHVKEKRANDIRRKLGITPIQLISDSFYGGIKNITSSTAMQKTSENVKYFGQSYLVQGSKSAATYTKSGLSNLGTGVVTGMGSLKNSRLFSSMYGFKPNPTEEEQFVEVIAPPEGGVAPSESNSVANKNQEGKTNETI